VVEVRLSLPPVFLLAAAASLGLALYLAARADCDSHAAGVTALLASAGVGVFAAAALISHRGPEAKTLPQLLRAIVAAVLLLVTLAGLALLVVVIVAAVNCASV